MRTFLFAVTALAFAFFTFHADASAQEKKKKGGAQGKVKKVDAALVFYLHAGE